MEGSRPPHAEQKKIIFLTSMLTCKYGRFSLPKSITYLNCAYMAPLLKSVEKAGVRGVRLKRNPAIIKPGDFYSDQQSLKQAFAKLINANDANRIAVIPSVSYGMANVTRNITITKGENILVASEQFPSNYYPWQMLCQETGAELKVVAPDGESKERGKNWNLRFLENITNKTRVVAIANVHWTDGTLFDLKAIRKRTREVGALLIVDGTQSVGALPIDVAEVDPDALICASYKWLLGPYSIGLAYYGPHFDGGTPIEQNWINRLESENFSSLVSYQPEYQPGAARYSVGEQSNFILVPMALKAIEQINRWGVPNIQEYCESISKDAIEKLREKGFIVEDLPYRSSHLFGVRHSKEIDPDKLRSVLTRHKIYVSIRGNAIRVSPHVYNDADDLQRLVKALTSVV
jgi:selenocysteine lyase/cysteine desulfurase